MRTFTAAFSIQSLMAGLLFGAVLIALMGALHPKPFVVMDPGGNLHHCAHYTESRGSYSCF